MATQIIFQKIGNSYIFRQIGHFLRWLERLYFKKLDFHISENWTFSKVARKIIFRKIGHSYFGKLDIHILENWTFSKVASWLVWCFPSILLRTQTIFTFAKSGKISHLKQVHFDDRGIKNILLQFFIEIAFEIL